MSKTQILSKEEIDRRQRAAIANHIPGKTHRHADGVAYVVQPNCAWKRQSPRRHEGRTGFSNAARRRLLKAV